MHVHTEEALRSLQGKPLQPVFCFITAPHGASMMQSTQSCV
jgi:hypothetical protein